jgi:superfamily II DNA or RNA helicase
MDPDIIRTAIFPPRFALDGKVLKSPVRQLAHHDVKLGGSVETVRIGRTDAHAFRTTDGEVILLTERRYRADQFSGSILRCANLDDFLSGNTEELSGEWLSPAPREPRLLGRTENDELTKAVRERWRNAFIFREERREGNEVTETGLRPPQIGALFGVLSHWKASTLPATVVMPTGTGKTETMLALLARERLTRLLVIVPTGALRDQIGDKFLRMGLLKDLGVLDPAAPLPIVGYLQHKPKSPEEVDELFLRCNVIVTTMAIAGQCTDEAQTRMAEVCSHLFIDEAHHISARTWEGFRGQFSQKPIVQFTATPFRNDNKHVDGRVVFNYPLRKAQAEGYFKEIRFLPVDELDLVEADQAIAETALAQLTADLSEGFRHVVMARCDNIPRAKKIHALYEELAPEHSPLILHNEVSANEGRERLAKLRNGDSKIVVCVDMLGEGFDLPELKIAAVHDPHKSLAITLQFTGRFTRFRSDLGDATMIANIADPGVGEALQDLYAEDADWNSLLRDLSEGANTRQTRRSEFLDAFQDVPETVALRNIFPKMSAVVYRAKTSRWRPERAVSAMGNTEIYAGPTVNERYKVLLFITREHESVVWGDVRDIRNTEWHLYLAHWDEDRKLLYINSSNKGSMHEDLAKAICGDDVNLIKGELVFRSLHNINRLVLTNLGLSDVINERLRFSMHVGADISDALPEALRTNKRKSNLFAHGYEEGKRVTVGCSQKGRVGSMTTAEDLASWVDWCHGMGAKLRNDTISTRDVFTNVILPEEIKERPALVPLLVDWPEDFLKRSEDAITIIIDGEQVPFYEAELRVLTFKQEGPILFRVATPSKFADYKLKFAAGSVEYEPTGAFSAEVRIGRTTRPLGEWFRKEPPAIRFENGGYLEGTELFVPPRGAGRKPFDKGKIDAWAWSGVDISKESQDLEKRPDSIQRRVLDCLLADLPADAFPIIFDDDGSGEAADIVCIGTRDGRLLVHLYHCKFSSGTSPGARVGDLYEVCGQAQRSAHWRGAVEELFKHLRRRDDVRKARLAKAGAAHITRFERGDIKALRELSKQAKLLMPELTVHIAQPGLSKGELNTKQRELLGATELYLMDTAAIQLRVIASE